jgi:hypothetical protein
MRSGHSIIAIALVLVGCGARSELVIGDAERGGGAAGSGANDSVGSGRGPGSGGGGGATSGSGGGLVETSCEPLGVRPLAGPEDAFEHQPVLTRSQGGATVTLGYRDYGMNIAFQRQTTFDPWSSWPAGEPVAEGLQINGALIPDPAVLASAPNGYAMMDTQSFHIAYFHDAPPSELGPEPILLQDFPGGRALFLGELDGGLRLGAVGKGLGDDEGVEQAHFVVGTASALLLGEPFACASSLLSAAATRTPGAGWLVATTSGAPHGSCGDFAEGELPTRLQVLHVTADANGSTSDTLLHEELPGAVLGEVAVSPTPSGAWVVWDDSGSGALRGLHLEANGMVTVPSMALDVPFEGDGGWNIEPTAGGFVLVQLETGAMDASSSIGLAFVDATGATVHEQVVELGFTLGEGISSLYDSETGELLLAVREVSGGGFDNTSYNVALAKLACPAW